MTTIAFTGLFFLRELITNGIQKTIKISYDLVLEMVLELLIFLQKIMQLFQEQERLCLKENFLQRNPGIQM